MPNELDFDKFRIFIVEATTFTLAKLTESRHRHTDLHLHNQ